MKVMKVMIKWRLNKIYKHSSCPNHIFKGIENEPVMDILKWKEYIDEMPLYLLDSEEKYGFANISYSVYFTGDPR